MAQHTSVPDLGLRRRLTLLGLGLSPADVRTAARAHPSKVSLVLGGTGRLRPEQAASLGRLAARRLRDLFAQ